MDTLFEQNVAQNMGLTAFAISQAVIRFSEERQTGDGLNVFSALLVPPLVYHRRTAESLASKQMTDGLFFRFVSEDRELVLGLQSRLMATMEQSFKAIHLACSSRMVHMSRNHEVSLLPNIRSLPGEVDGPKTSDQVRNVFAAAKRIGYCFATTDFAVICASLRVRF